MPEPNLPPLHVCLEGASSDRDVVSVSEVRESLGEMPEGVRRRLVADGLDLQYAARISEEEDFLALYQETRKLCEFNSNHRGTRSESKLHVYN